MDSAEGINRAGRLWLLGNSATLRAIGREGYASRGRGCVTVRLAPSGRSIEEPVYRPVAELPAVDRVAAEAADGAASYDPERLTLVLVEQERAPTREFLLLDADGTALAACRREPDPPDLSALSVYIVHTWCAGMP